MKKPVDIWARICYNADETVGGFGCKQKHFKKRL